MILAYILPRERFMKWQGYHEDVGLRPNSGVVRLCATHKGRKAALDLGCGNLRDSLFLRQSGFERVVAVDLHDPPQIFDGIEFHKSSIEAFFPMFDTFDMVVCCNTLFYVQKERMPVLISRIYNSLRSGGIFYGNLATDKDEWVLKESWTGYSQVEVVQLLAGITAKVTRTTGQKAMASGQEKFSDTWTVRITKD